MAGREHPNRLPSRRFLERVQRGEVESATSTEVLQEILYRYAALHRLDPARTVFVVVCPEVLPVTLADTDRARDLILSDLGLSARDAVHAAVMLNHQIEYVVSFDRGFDDVPGLTRIEPD